MAMHPQGKSLYCKRGEGETDILEEKEEVKGGTKISGAQWGSVCELHARQRG